MGNQRHGGYATRREVVVSLAAAVASSALAGGAAPAQASPLRLVDTHHHFYAPSYQQAWRDWAGQHKVPVAPLQASWSPAQTLEEMDRSGTRAAVLSLPSTPGLWFDKGPAEAVSMARACNDYAAGMVREQPRRLGLFAALPMVDIDASLREIEYALDTLKADGIGLQTNYGDKWPGDPAFRAVFEELNRRKAVVYFHPLAASCCGNLSLRLSPSVIEVPHDTTRAVMSLLLNGCFARYRDIKWLFSHAGGTVPMLAGRIDYFTARMAGAAEFAPHGVEYELKRLHYDTANATHPSSMAALLKLVPVSQIVFGTDYPYVRIAPQDEALRKLHLAASQLRAIESGNAVRLVPRLSA